ncbi:probable alpha-amylase 2 isoform X2 [Physcomitrium patens]|uniref:probable alpha-amylase 2 isoform X2 n=1 Tax=Physcomitrium patens TaxID=3218 RepID=UPI000D17A8B3|nr:probable alpha-amylase 2 isoform X2 [Physcomitrium patens]|eukprot:XP_024389718.1 probable alpha-amylase 2 isoform X2 [Physcomitrella patens]
MWISAFFIVLLFSSFKEVLFLERTLELSCRERERVQKRPRLSACLSVGETILDGEEAVDGAGESKGGKSPMQDDGSESLSSSQEFAEKGKEDSAKKEVYTERFKSIDTRVEEVEDARCDESGEDLIRRGKEIFLQGFNWESHKQQWWRSLKRKVSELAGWGFTSLWLPPVCDSLAPQGYLPKNLYNLNSAYGSEVELRSLLQHMKKSGLKPMADIVINHRVGSTRGKGDLYNRYDGLPMPWDEYAVSSDTGGLGKPSTGEIFKGVPNLDHSSEVVANDLKNWLEWMRKDVGFECFRFDYAKGYSPKFVKAYIEASKPRLAIGEYWDTCKYIGPNYLLDYNQDAHRQRTVDWIDGTGGLSCAFDFTTKAILQEACAKEEWYRLRDAQGRPPGLLGVWPSRAVTFIDNHDTGSTQAHWPFPRNCVAQGYAYILTHPGQPCVFYDHLYEWSGDLKRVILELIDIRRKLEVHSRSHITILEADTNGYSAVVDNKLCVRLGNTEWTPPSDSLWELTLSGSGYMIWSKPQPLLTSQ